MTVMTPRYLPADTGSPNEYMRSVDNIQGAPSASIPHGSRGAIRAVRPFHRIKLYHLTL
jgi:hypothetical protein